MGKEDFINRYPKEVNPQDTNRGDAFSLWITSPMPMVTLVKTFNISRLLKYSRKYKLSFNMLMCWCIGKAASGISEFYLLPMQGKLYQYDKIAVNVIVKNMKGSINSCDIQFCNDLQQFADDYRRLTEQVAPMREFVLG